MAIRHRMGEIAKTPLTYTADVTDRGHLHPGTAEDDTLGPTVTELASGERALLLLLRAHQRAQLTARLRRLIKPFYLHYKLLFSLERSGLILLGSLSGWQKQ